MKKLALIAILLASYSFAKVITIIDNGVERKIEINVDISKVKARAVNSSSVGIIVAFKDDTIDVEEFANKYNLKLKKRLKIGYYIFENQSKKSDLELIANISKNSKKVIKTIRPNWGFGMGAR